jgi:hypothetical protein
MSNVDMALLEVHFSHPLLHAASLDCVPKLLPELFSAEGSRSRGQIFA